MRLAYATEFLIAIIAVFVLWGQVGGQTHLDPLPWFVKLGLGGGVAFAAVKATAEAVSQDVAWHRGTLKWCSILLALLGACGMASLYSHNFLESEEPGDTETITSSVEKTTTGRNACGTKSSFLRAATIFSDLSAYPIAPQARLRRVDRPKAYPTGASTRQKLRADG